MTVVIIVIVFLLLGVFACIKIAGDCSRQEEAGTVDEIYTVPKEKGDGEDG